MDKQDTEGFLIQPATEADWDGAMELAFRTFMKFEGMEYGREGINNFATLVTDPALKKMFLAGLYPVFVAKHQDNLIGLISLRSGNHISLLFVDEKYHRRGVGTALIHRMGEYLLQNTHFMRMTVNAAPYGVPFYHELGFLDIAPLTKKDGITYVPMELNIENRECFETEQKN